MCSSLSLKYAFLNLGNACLNTVLALLYIKFAFSAILDNSACGRTRFPPLQLSAPLQSHRKAQKEVGNFFNFAADYFKIAVVFFEKAAILFFILASPFFQYSFHSTVFAFFQARTASPASRPSYLPTSDPYRKMQHGGKRFSQATHPSPKRFDKKPSSTNAQEKTGTRLRYKWETGAYPIHLLK